MYSGHYFNFQLVAIKNSTIRLIHKHVKVHLEVAIIFFFLDFNLLKGIGLWFIICGVILEKHFRARLWVFRNVVKVNIFPGGWGCGPIFVIIGSLIDRFQVNFYFEIICIPVRMYIFVFIYNTNNYSCIIRINFCRYLCAFDMHRW